MTLKMNIKSVLLTTAIAATGLWAAGGSPALAQQPGIAQETAAPGKPMVLKKFTRKRSRHTKRSSSRTRKTTRTPEARNNTAAAQSDPSERDKTLAKQTTNAQASAITQQTMAEGSHLPTVTGKMTQGLSPEVTNARAEVQASSKPFSADKPATDKFPSALVPENSDSSSSLQPQTAAAEQHGPANSFASNAQPSSTQASSVTPSSINSQQSPSPSSPPLRLMPVVSKSGEAVSADHDSPWKQISMIGKIFVAFGGLLTVASAARMLVG